MLVEQADLTRQIESITVNLRRYVKQIVLDMAQVNPENAAILCDYITAELTEKNIADGTRDWKLKTLVWLSKTHKHTRSYRSMTKADILVHLNALRKPIEQDPDNRWIGTYNNRVLVLTHFFRWLYSPGEADQKKRKTPDCMNGVKHLPTKNKTNVKPSDLWTPAEHDLFLRYCPLSRDKCYHAMARDTSARPHELLKLKIGDVQFRKDPGTGRQYAEILVSGKTKTRTLPLIDSLPYVKQWIAEHPEGGNPTSPLFITMAYARFGFQLSPNSLLRQYRKQYQASYFPKLLQRDDVPPSDKELIRSMLKKPWNLYVFRHSALTEKAQMLKEATLRDHAGWTMTSKMPAIYIHFFGAESSRSLLEARGIIAKDKQANNILETKACPHCKEPNAPHSKFCSKCSLVLTYDTYVETVEKQDSSAAELKELRATMMDRDYHNKAFQEAAYAQYLAEQKAEQLRDFLIEIAKKTGLQVPKGLLDDNSAMEENKR